MEIIMLTASVAASTIRSLLSKQLSSASGRLASFGRVNGLMSFCALIVISAYTTITNGWNCSLYTVVMATLYALFTFSAQFFYMRGLSSGDVAAVTFFYSCGFIIPTFMGTFLFHETVSALRIIGIGILVIAFRLCAEKSASNNTPYIKGWILCAFAAMLSSGIVGLIQKVHQSSVHRSELGSFLAIAFAICSAASFALACVKKTPDSATKREWIPTCICGLCVGAANLLNLYLAGILPAMVTFPVLNGGVIVAAAVAASLIYREKISRRRVVGLVFGITAILLIAC